ncbi:MAG TPA: hypothetical protein VGF99_17330 [Myxococcota bacterium]
MRAFVIVVIGRERAAPPHPTAARERGRAAIAHHLSPRVGQVSTDFVQSHMTIRFVDTPSIEDVLVDDS